MPQVARRVGAPVVGEGTRGWVAAILARVGFRGTIVTLGGAGFSMGGEDSRIDDFLLDLTGKVTPKMCFVPTASGDDRGYIQRFEAAFQGRATTSVLSLYCKDDQESWFLDPTGLLEQDVVYVGGGSTANLLAVWRVHGMRDVLRDVAAKGSILTGVSAGMNCWFEASSTDSFGQLAPLQDGLGLLPGSACPHYLGEAERRAKYRGWVASQQLPDGYAADDYTAIVFRDGEFVEAIAEQPNHPAYRVERREDAAVEAELDVRLLV